MRYLVFLLCLFACSKEKPETAPLGMDPALQAKAALYRELAPSVLKFAGFVNDDCDALLFSSLAAVGGYPVDLTAARNDDGQWFRTTSKDCYPDRSSSSISRDMLLGVIMYAYAARDLDMVERLYAYGDSHNWVMGTGLLNRTLFTPQLIATLAQVIFKLGGEDHFTRRLPVAWSASGVNDFEAHLQVIHIVIRRAVYDTIEESAQSTVNDQAARQPANPFFQWAAGDTSRATELLLNEAQWPSDRLPTSAEHCSPWPIERDDTSSGWAPCDEKLTHSGGELAFVARLIEEGI